MIENVMQQMGGIGMFGIISICIFFVFFTGMLLWAVRLKKPYLNNMGSLPLESEPQNNEAACLFPTQTKLEGRAPSNPPHVDLAETKENPPSPFGRGQG